MMEEISKYKQQIEQLQNENKFLKENQEKFNLLNDLFSEMLNLQDLESIYKYISVTLQKCFANTIVLYVSVNEQANDTRLEAVEGISNKFFNKILNLSGFNPIGKKFKLLPKHNDYFRAGKLVEFSGGLGEFSASEFPYLIAKSIENLIGLHKIYTIGILKDEHLFAAIHFLTFSKTVINDNNFIEAFVKRAGIILQKKIAEKELKESEQKYQALVQYSSNPIFCFNPDETYRFVNDVFAKTFGKHPDDIIGKTPHSIFPYEEAEKRLKLVRQVFKTREKGEIEVKVITPAGNELYFLTVADPIKDDQGTIQWVLCISKDITEYKHIEQALKESEAKTKAILHTIPDLMFIQDYEGIYIDYFIPKGTETLIPPSVFMGQKMQNVLPDNILNGFSPIFQKAISTQQLQVFEYSLPVADKLHFYELRTICYDESKVLSIIRDMTEHHLAAETIREQNIELKKLNTDKDRFLSILGHDLRSPFNAIIGYSELLLKTTSNNNFENIEHYAENINVSAKKAFQLLNDLLMWANAESGNLSFNPQKLIFTAISSEVIDILAPAAKNKNISIISLAGNNLNVMADSQMLKTVLRNLISNAIKFTDPGGVITINAEKDISNIMISVSDNGIGIDATEINKLFDVAQIHSTLGTANEGGTGLGLLLCKQFVEKHHGIIWVESEMGKGSEFKFTLPLNNEN